MHQKNSSTTSIHSHDKKRKKEQYDDSDLDLSDVLDGDWKGPTPCKDEFDVSKVGTEISLFQANREAPKTIDESQLKQIELRKELIDTK